MNDPDPARRHCMPLPASTAPLDRVRAEALLAGLDGWVLDGGKLCKTFRFADYHQTVAFVNATAWISHREDHHPDIALGYGQCTITYSTHSVGGLSENDFICAAKIDALFAL